MQKIVIAQLGRPAAWGCVTSATYTFLKNGAAHQNRFLSSSVSNPAAAPIETTTVKPDQQQQQAPPISIDFDDCELAFKSKSNKDLLRGLAIYQACLVPSLAAVCIHPALGRLLHGLLCDLSGGPSFIHSVLLFSVCLSPKTGNVRLQNGRKLLAFSDSIFGKKLTELFMRYTIFPQFAAGVSGEAIQPVIDRLEKYGLLLFKHACHPGYQFRWFVRA